MIVYVCPECGSELQHLTITTYPPINVVRCPNCGWRHEDKSKFENIEYVPFPTTRRSI